MHSVFFRYLAYALAVAAADSTVSCNNADDRGVIKVKSDGMAGVADAHGSGRPTPLTTREALEFIDENCSECHGPGKALAAAFSIPAREDLLKGISWLEGAALNQTAYQVLVNKHLKNSDSPTAMPPEFKNAEQEKKLPNLIAWFQDTLPSAVREAEIKFGSKPEFRSNIRVELNAKCEKIVSGLDFQNRFMTRALGRQMNIEDSFENNLLSADEKQQPATAEVRKRVVEKILEVPKYKVMFVNVAVASLAQKIANSGAIAVKGKNVSPALTAAQLRDLQFEFSELVKRHHETSSYPELFLMNKVMVTANTAPLYNSSAAEVAALPQQLRDKYRETCASPAQGAWGECTLSPKRGNFFGTRGFLVSKPTAVFQNNNNYGRGGDTHQVIFGEVLMANTDGVSGDKPRPIPECLSKTSDNRWVLKEKGVISSSKAAWGAIAIPFYGRVCQGCHLNRHLAAASVIFRPFGFAGEIIFPQMMTSNNGGPVDIYAGMGLIQNPRAAGANGPDERTHVTHTDAQAQQFRFIDPVFYRGLLEELDNNPNATCFPDPSDPLNESKAKFANSLSQYAEYLIYQNDTGQSQVRGTAMIRGLTRFLPSTFANVNTTNLEVIGSVGDAFVKNGGKLVPMMTAYFQTESFGCAGR